VDNMRYLSTKLKKLAVTIMVFQHVCPIIWSIKPSTDFVCIVFFTYSGNKMNNLKCLYHKSASLFVKCWSKAA